MTVSFIFQLNAVQLSEGDYIAEIRSIVLRTRGLC